MASGVPDIVFPVNPSKASVWYDEPVSRFISQPTQFEQRFRVPGRWRFHYEWQNMSHADAYFVLTYFRLKGLGQSFSIYDIARPLPTGNALVSALASLVVNGGAQVGQSVAVRGAPATTLIFKRGDVIGFANTKQMVEIAADATTDGAGHATLLISQFLGASPVDGEAVVVSFVPVTVFLDTPVQPTIDVPELYGLTVDFSEALP